MRSQVLRSFFFGPSGDKWLCCGGLFGLVLSLIHFFGCGVEIGIQHQKLGGTFRAKDNNARARMLDDRKGLVRCYTYRKGVLLMLVECGEGCCEKRVDYRLF